MEDKYPKLYELLKKTGFPDSFYDNLADDAFVELQALQVSEAKYREACEGMAKALACFGDGRILLYDEKKNNIFIPFDDYTNIRQALTNYKNLMEQS